MSTDRKVVELIINSEQAQKELDDINKQLIKARENKEKAVQIGNQEGVSKYTKEIDKLEYKMKKMQTRSESVRKAIEEIDKATPKQLKDTIRAINKELDSGRIEKGSEEWKTLQERMKLVKEELTRIKEETKAATSLSDEVAEWGNKWMGIAMNFMAVKEAIDSVMQTASDAVSKFADMEEHLAGVVKYTGMTKEEVYELNQEFKKMDTRTPREKLNDLAGDAGRLGIQAKKDVLDFVDAANQINVALGEDLGEDAVKNIGKLTQLYGIDDKKGLKKGMLAIASIINDQGQSSSAAEGYIMDYTSRMAGLARQAGITADQIMAYASVTDQSMIRSEEASTALSNLIQKLYQEPKEMANAVGIPVKEFTETIKKDANEAVLQWLTAVKAMGGMEKVAPMLKDVSMTGAGVTKMITSLANNVELLRSTQEQASKSFEEGTSITNEYNVANNTVQASLEKAQKKGKDLRIELGKRLYPIMKEGLNLGNKVTKLMIAILDFSAKHSASIVNLAITIGVLTATMKLHTIATLAMNAATKTGTIAMGAYRAAHVAYHLTLILCTKGVKALQLAMAGLNKTMKMNIFGLAAAAAGTLVVTLTELCKKEEELTEKQKLQNKINKDSKDIEKASNKEMAEKASKVNALTAIIHNNNLKLEDRKKAVEALKKIIPKYYAELDEEGRITKENTKAVKDHIEMLKQEAILKAAKEKISSLSSEKLDAETAKKQSEDIISENKKKIEEWKKENEILAKYIQWNKDGTIKKSTKPNEHPAYIASKKEVNNFKPEGKKPNGYSEQDWLYAVWLNKYTELEKINRVLISENKKIEDQTAKAENIDTRISEIAKRAKETSALIDSLIENSEEEEKNTGNPKEKLEVVKEKIKNLYELKRLKNRILFEEGKINREDFIRENEKIEIEALEKEKSLYDKGTKDWISLENKKRDAINEQKKRGHDYSLNQIKVEIAEEKAIELAKYAKGEIDEKEYQRRITEIQIQEKRRRANYLLANDPGSEAQQKAQMQYTEAMQEEQIRKQKEYQQKIKDFQKEYNQKSNEEKMRDELKFLDELVKNNVIAADKKKEYEDKIRKKYKDDEESPLDGRTNEIASSVIATGIAIDNLQKKLKEGKADWEDYAAVGIAAISMLMPMMNAASQLMQANTQMEEAKIKQKYDAEIKAAGKNEKRKKQIEEKRDREIAKMKSKQNKKAMKMEIAQAVASTAMAAINAYASASKVSFILGPIAAAAATAAGMIQIAAIKKQHEVQEATGYYEGGFTSGNNYHKKAGIVHEGEFVANHKAVNNPAVIPYLRAIDFAQRNNTISRITEKDMAGINGIGATNKVISQVQIVDTSSAETAEAIEKLNKIAEKGIPAYVVIDGDNGLDRQWKLYQEMTNR